MTFQVAFTLFSLFLLFTSTVSAGKGALYAAQFATSLGESNYLQDNLEVVRIDPKDGSTETVGFAGRVLQTSYSTADGIAAVSNGAYITQFGNTLYMVNVTNGDSIPSYTLDPAGEILGITPRIPVHYDGFEFPQCIVWVTNDYKIDDDGSYSNDQIILNVPVTISAKVVPPLTSVLTDIDNPPDKLLYNGVKDVLYAIHETYGYPDDDYVPENSTTIYIKEMQLYNETIIEEKRINVPKNCLPSNDWGIYFPSSVFDQTNNSIIAPAQRGIGDDSGTGFLIQVDLDTKECYKVSEEEELFYEVQFIAWNEEDGELYIYTFDNNIITYTMKNGYFTQTNDVLLFDTSGNLPTSMAFGQ